MPTEALGKTILAATVFFMTLAFVIGLLLGMAI